MRESTPPGAPVRRAKDGRSWRIGTQIDVDWILDGTETGLSITSGIPPVFEAYATVVLPDRNENRPLDDELLLGLLGDESGAQPWWLGYLDVGTQDVLFPDVPMVTLYVGWQYVLIEAGRSQAADWRTDNGWRGAVPDRFFQPTAHGCCQRCGMTTGAALADPDTWCNASSSIQDLIPAKSASASTRHRRDTLHGDTFNLKDWR